MYFPLELFPNFGLKEYRYSTSTVANAVNLARQRRTLSVVNPTAVGRTKLTLLAAVDVRPTILATQLITLSVQLCGGLGYSTMSWKQRVARVHLHQLILVITDRSSFRSTTAAAV